MSDMEEQDLLDQSPDPYCEFCDNCPCTCVDGEYVFRGAMLVVCHSCGYQWDQMVATVCPKCFAWPKTRPTQPDKGEQEP